VSDDATIDIRVLIDDVLTSGRAIAEQPGTDAYARWAAARDRLARRLASLGDQLILAEDPHDAADQALLYLEADPYYFWSGYARARIARRLAQARLDATQRERARRYVLDCIAGTKHCDQSGLGPLAHAVADNPTRKAARSQLHSADARVARRALRTLSRIRRPGLTEADIAVAREIVLADAVHTAWLPPNVERLARWLWTPEWEAELRDLTQHHGPERAPAKKLIESMDHRRARRRPGP
jgi:hypothetical protein